VALCRLLVGCGVYWFGGVGLRFKGFVLHLSKVFFYSFDHCFMLIWWDFWGLFYVGLQRVARKI